MKNFVIAPAVAALAMFFWGFLYFGVSGVPYRVLQPSATLAPALAQLPASGTYLVPDPRDGADPATYRGPAAKVSYTTQLRPMSTTLLIGYLHGFVSCGLLALLLWRTGAALGGFRCKFFFCLVTGLLVTFFAHICDVAWWQGDLAWAAASMAHDLVAFALAGAILAQLVTPRPA
jgi:hypothetical protein